MSAEYGRLDVCDLKIGELLARSVARTVAGIADADVWPDRAVCEALEMIGSRSVANGFVVGTLNARGVTKRGAYEGGEQERTLAKTYLGLSDLIDVEYPFVGRILREIAITYNGHAGRHDSEVELRQRLNS